MNNEKRETLPIPATAFGAQNVVSLAWLALPRSRMAWGQYLERRGRRLTDWETDPLTPEERQIWRGELQAIYNEFMALATDAIVDGFEVDVPSYLDRLNDSRKQILARFTVIGAYERLYSAITDLKRRLAWERERRDRRHENIVMSEATHPVGSWKPEHVPRKTRLSYLGRDKE